MFATQRLAFRIARREALRYKGRSALSIALLGLPLLGVAIGASAYDSTTLSPEEEADLFLGSTDAFVERALPGEPITQFTWDDQYPWYEMVDEDADPREAVSIADAEVLAALPVGTRLAPFSIWGESGEQSEVVTPDGLGSIDVYGYDLTDPTYKAAGLVFLEGSAPGRGEIAISEDAASYLDVGVGGEVTTGSGLSEQEFTVSGIVELPWNINARYAIGSMFPDSSNGWLVDVPDELTHEEALKLNELGLSVWAGSLVDLPPVGQAAEMEAYAIDEASYTIYGLIIVVVLMEVVLLAGPAFAISARRRVREFALMSASGATPRQIRAVVLAGGALFGLIAAAVAVGLGIAVTAVGMPLVEQLIGFRVPGLRVAPALQLVLVAVAILTGLLSALAAAVSASRVNVVAALMGRTPRRKGSKRWMVLGLVMVGGGIAAGLAGITSWNLPLMASAIVLLQLGLVACTPALLAATARLGRWLPLAPRMALREAGRNRGSAAPAIAAVLGVVAGGMAFTLTVAADNVRAQSNQERIVPEGTVTLTFYYNGAYNEETGEPEDTAAWDEALAESASRMEQRLADLELVPVPVYDGGMDCSVGAADFPEGTDLYCNMGLVRPEENRCPYWEVERESPDDRKALEAAVEAAREDERCDENWSSYGYGIYEIPTTTDPQVVSAYTGLEGEELDAAVAVLEDGGVLVADPLAVTDGTAVFETETWAADSEMTDEGEEVSSFHETVVPAYAVEKGLLGYSKVLVSPGAAEVLGMSESMWSKRYLVATSTTVDGAVTEAVAADLSLPLGDGGVSANFSVADYTDRGTFYMMLAVAALCALITLGSTAVSTGLIIAEQQRDMTTLGAVGAAPGLRKRYAMWQTVMIALFGTVLGTVAGVIGYALIREALNRPLQNRYPFETLYGWELPWASFGIMLLAVPLLAAAGALVFTRARLASERRLT